MGCGDFGCFRKELPCGRHAHVRFDGGGEGGWRIQRAATKITGISTDGNHDEPTSGIHVKPARGGGRIERPKAPQVKALRERAAARVYAEQVCK